MYEINEIRFIQNGRVFYTAVMPAKDLVRISDVDIWNAERNLGYQRAPSITRLRSIAKYLVQDNAILPIGGLVNARPKTTENEVDDSRESYGSVLNFTPQVKNGEIAIGDLEIPDDVLPLYIVDMQHRIKGIEWAIEQNDAKDLEDFPLVVTIADGLPKMEEIDQFDLINTTQKKVRTDLARRLKVLQARDSDRRLDFDKAGKLWEAKGPMIADILNKTDGVWKERILPPNKSKSDQPTMIIPETSFVTSLKPILRTPYFARQEEGLSALLINYYWNALNRVFPNAFANPENYVIQKTPGLYSLHEIAPEVFELARDSGKVDEKSIYNIVKSLGNLGDEFWESDNLDGAAQYGSMKGFKYLAADLRQELPRMSLKTTL